MAKTVRPELKSINSPPMTGGQQHTAVFGGGKINYLALGEGKTTLVFIHGWACNLNFWCEQVSAFASRAKLILIDLPGHGQSDKPVTNYSMDFLAQAVVAVLKDARVDKAVLIGHSMGASVMCCVYRQVPDKVAALVSVDGLLCRPPGTPERTLPFINQFRVPEYRTYATRFFSTFFPCPGTEALRDRVIQEMLATPQHVIASVAEHLFSPGHPDWALSAVAVPVLVLNARSPLWNRRYEKYVKSLSPVVDYRAYGDVGHFLMLENPAVINQELAAMLEQCKLLPA